MRRFSFKCSNNFRQINNLVQFQAHPLFAFRVYAATSTVEQVTGVRI
jgi:hypothetical protein